MVSAVGTTLLRKTTSELKAFLLLLAKPRSYHTLITPSPFHPNALSTTYIFCYQGPCQATPYIRKALVSGLFVFIVYIRLGIGVTTGDFLDYFGEGSRSKSILSVALPSSLTSFACETTLAYVWTYV